MRKARAFYFTVVVVLVVVLAGFFAGIQYTGDQIITIGVMVCSLSGAFFGANFGEHWAKTKAQK